MLVEPGFFRTELLTQDSTRYAEPVIADYAEPPLRWAAGADAVGAFEQNSRQLLAQADAHRELSGPLAPEDATADA
jgi:hypothetical protein